MECLLSSLSSQSLPNFCKPITPQFQPISYSNLNCLRPIASRSHSLRRQLPKPITICRAVGRDDKDAEDQDAFTPIEEEEEGEEDEKIDDVYDIDLRIEKTGKSSRRITSTIEVEAPLEAVWNVLTDYERLADFLPGLAVSQLLERRENGARLLQIGQQNLVFGLKFKAKGIVDVYENELEVIPSGIRRDIDFKMVEGDFQVFEGKWGIEQVEDITGNQSNMDRKRYRTLLSYTVNVQPKRWLPVGLIEGRLSKEIQVNLTCIRNQVMSTAVDVIAAF